MPAAERDRLQERTKYTRLQFKLDPKPAPKPEAAAAEAAAAAPEAAAPEKEAVQLPPTLSSNRAPARDENDTSTDCSMVRPAEWLAEVPRLGLY